MTFEKGCQTFKRCCFGTKCGATVSHDLFKEPCSLNTTALPKIDATECMGSRAPPPCSDHQWTEYLPTLKRFFAPFVAFVLLRLKAPD